MDVQSYLVVLTSGMDYHKARTDQHGFPGERYWRPNLEGHMRLAAAAELRKKLATEPKVIFTGGHTKGQDRPSLAKVLKQEAIQKYDIPEEDTLLEEYSLDTTENAEYTLDLIDNPNSILHLITNEFHLNRAYFAFLRQKKKHKQHGSYPLIIPRSAESILLERNKTIINKLGEPQEIPIYKIIDEWLKSELQQSKAKKDLLFHLATSVLGERFARRAARYMMEKPKEI